MHAQCDQDVERDASIREVVVQDDIPRTDEGAKVGTSDGIRNSKELGRGMRTKILSVRLREFVTNTIRNKSPSRSSPSTSNHSSGTPYPITHYVNCALFSVRHIIFFAAITAGHEPLSYREAVQSIGWRVAMHKDINALEDNGTWVMEILPPGKKGYR